MEEANIRREDVLLLVNKYPELRDSHPHLHRDLEQREKFYLDLVYSLLNKNKELHHQANINYHAFKQKEVELTTLQLKYKEFAFEKHDQLPNCRNIIINFHSGPTQTGRESDREERKSNGKQSGMKLPIIEEERETERRIRMPMDTKRSVTVEDESKPSSSEVFAPPQPEPVKISMQDITVQTDELPSISLEKVDASTLTQFRDPPPIERNQQPAILEKVVQFRSIGSVANPEQQARLPEQSMLRASSTKEYPTLAQTLNKDQTSSKGATSTHSVRKLDYRRYLNELEDVRESSYTQPIQPISRSEYLLPQAAPAIATLHPASPRSTVDLQRSSLSQIQRLKEDNRNILRRIQTMGM